MDSKKHRTYRLTILLTEEIKAELESVATSMGLSMSSYVAHLIGHTMHMQRTVQAPMLESMKAVALEAVARALDAKP